MSHFARDVRNLLGDTVKKNLSFQMSDKLIVKKNTNRENLTVRENHSGKSPVICFLKTVKFRDYSSICFSKCILICCSVTGSCQT